MELSNYEKDHLNLVLETAAECCVLLKSNGSFPLEKTDKLAVFGNGVRHTIKGGTGSGEVNSKFSVNIEKGLTEAGFEITSSEWLNSYDEVRLAAKKQFIKNLKAEAKAMHANAFMYSMGKSMPEPEHGLKISSQGETAIFVVSRDSGEGNDRQVKAGDVKLTESEIRDILFCNDYYRNFMLVLNVGGVVDLSPVMQVSNILLLSQLGVVTGNILADILLGKQIPSGKLTTSWAAYEDYSTEGDFGDINETHYKEGIYVGYRYFDSVGIKPLFPFGYGLSYTDFSFKDAQVSLEGSKVSVSVEIENTGKLPGKEVAQVYLSAPSGKLDKPYQELVAFAKTDLLSSGAKERVSLSFDLKDFASYNEETASYLLEKGEYLVRLGNSSLCTDIVARISLDETVTTLKARNVCGKAGFEDYKPMRKDIDDSVRNFSDIGQCVYLELKASDIEVSEVKYGRRYPVADLVASLSDEELAFMNVGSHDPDKKGLAAVIGNASPHIAGGAGETCSRYEKKGIGYLTMSDGPAGLRLAKDYYEDEKGAHAIGSSMLPESMKDFMSGPMKFLMNVLGLGGAKAPKNAQVKHQYATAIPIGTAIAQSFNKNLAMAYGDMVGSEMEMFGVNLWLAPALNIHRSILCGRNFEYYSEDPLVSGIMAGAITLGVQNHKGCGTTIKHYAANNQEINRYGSNSNVSERALREIYLKGFGICVRMSQPHALMTSYNLINGIHTAEHAGLIEDILRCEYGFEGIVMTDWTINGMQTPGCTYRNSLASEAAKVGNDLFMPGCKADVDNILSSMKEGKLDRKQVEVNVTRTLDMVKKLTGK